MKSKRWSYRGYIIVENFVFGGFHYPVSKEGRGQFFAGSFVSARDWIDLQIYPHTPTKGSPQSA